MTSMIEIPYLFDGEGIPPGGRLPVKMTFIDYATARIGVFEDRSCACLAELHVAPQLGRPLDWVEREGSLWCSFRSPDLVQDRDSLAANLRRRLSSGSPRNLLLMPTSLPGSAPAGENLHEGEPIDFRWPGVRYDRVALDLARGHAAGKAVARAERDLAIFDGRLRHRTAGPAKVLDMCDPGARPLRARNHVFEALEDVPGAMRFGLTRFRADNGVPQVGGSFSVLDEAAYARGSFGSRCEMLRQAVVDAVHPSAGPVLGLLPFLRPAGFEIFADLREILVSGFPSRADLQGLDHVERMLSHMRACAADTYIGDLSLDLPNARPWFADAMLKACEDDGYFEDAPGQPAP